MEGMLSKVAVVCEIGGEAFVDIAGKDVWLLHRCELVVVVGVQCTCKGCGRMPLDPLPPPSHLGSQLPTLKTVYLLPALLPLPLSSSSSPQSPPLYPFQSLSCISSCTCHPNPISDPKSAPCHCSQGPRSPGPNYQCLSIWNPSSATPAKL